MASKQLYATVIGEGGQDRLSSDAAKQLATQSALGGQSGITPLSTDPSKQNVSGQIQEPGFQGYDAGVIAAQLEELAEAGGIEYVPYTEPDGDGREADPGYYAVEGISANPVEPQERAAYSVEVSLSREGSRRSHWRAVHLSPTAVEGAIRPDQDGDGRPIPDPDQQVTVALPRQARRVRWFDPVSKGVEDAEPFYETVMGEQANFKHFRYDQATFYDGSADAPYDPALIYDLPYEREYKGDARVWDTLGNSPEDKVVQEYRGPRVGGSGVRVGDVDVGVHGVENKAGGQPEFYPGQRVDTTWQRVFRNGHDFAGSVVLGNGVLRVLINEEKGRVRCQRSRGAFDEWAEQPLRPSSWMVFDADISHIGLARVDAQIEFRHGRTGEHYTLDMTLPRGYERARWTIPQNQSDSVPGGLEQYLRPIATGGRHVDPNGRAGLVAREEVRL